MASTSQQQSPTVTKECPKAKCAKAKRRWTREEKALRRKELEQELLDNSHVQSRPKKPKRIPIPLCPSEKLLKCAQDAHFTGSVQYWHYESHEEQKGDNESIQVSTYCGCEKRPPPSHISSKWIHVQPLLIMDLNGILCHRIRHPTNPSSFRPSAANIANTPVIARVDLVPFLSFLDAHFTLAVWTSAKTKTAKQLVSLLFPIPVKERLLFIWGQPKCDAIAIQGKEKLLFQKPLSRVWNEYPLWDTTNTLLLDDSPTKCPDFANTLHPPRLDGRFHGESDLENEKLQFDFFQQLVTWLDDDSGDIGLFLQKCGRGHMGWRGGPRTL
jgi:hypothetical protein